jgi:hypothetical protein
MQYLLTEEELNEIKEAARVEGYNDGYSNGERYAKAATEKREQELAAAMHMLAQGNLNLTIDPVKGSTRNRTTSIRIPRPMVGMWHLRRSYLEEQDVVELWAE